MTEHDNLYGFGSIDRFVEDKLQRFEQLPKTFDTLFSMMFENEKNTLWETTNGFRTQKITYGETREHILARAGALKEYGFVSGDVIGLAMNNSPAWIECFWAILLAGCEPLLVNLRLDGDSVNSVISRMNVKAVISEQNVYSVRTILPEELSCTHAPLTEYTCGTQIWLMSSGTSLSVKVCAFGAEQMYEQIRGSYGIICESKLMKAHVDGELKLLTFLPFYHIFGLTAVYVWFTFFSRTLVLLNDLAPQTITNTIKKHRVTHVFAVPLFWEKVYQQAQKCIEEQGKTDAFRRALKLAAKPVIGPLITHFAFRKVRDGMFGDSIRFMISGGSAISPEIITFFNRVGYHLSNGYGATEIGITSVELDTNGKHLLSGSVGKPMCAVEYSISDDGELLVRGKSMATAVWDSDGQHSLCDGWYNTHDLACEEKGHYYLLGRRDDLVIGSAGENLCPDRIEEQFALPGVHRVCLLDAVENSSHLPTLLFSVSPYISADRLKALSDSVKEKLRSTGLSAQISRVLYTGASLINENEFKLNRARLRRALSNGEFTLITPENAVQTADINEELAARVTECVAKALGKSAEDVGLTSDFFVDEGGTSLDYFALITLLQQEFEISFPSENEKTLSTVYDLCRYIEKTL